LKITAKYKTKCKTQKKNRDKNNWKQECTNNKSYTEQLFI